MIWRSDAKVTIRSAADVRVTGKLAPHKAKIAVFVNELGLTKGTIRHRSGRFAISSDIDPATQQRIRNFLVNECPMKK